jgi:3-oxoacyl-[acyl-carrier-protein] synthase-3
MSFSIRSIAKYLPETILHAESLDDKASIRRGWIEKNTGVLNRHWASGNETVCGMAAKALDRAISSVGLNCKDLDLLIYAGSCHDYPVPHNSVIIKSMIADDRSTFNCLDIDTTCLSFIQAFDIASLYLDSGRYERIAIVSAEMPSIALHPSDPKVYGLFGDGAVAVILESVKEGGLEILHRGFENFPSGAYWAMVPTGGAHDRGRGYPADHEGYFFKMDGRKLIKLGTTHLSRFMHNISAHTGISICDIDYVVPHQASKMATEFLIKKFDIPRKHVVSTLAEYGNCISASVPLGLEKVFNSLRPSPGQTILLVGSGAGFSLGCILFRL